MLPSCLPRSDPQTAHVVAPAMRFANAHAIFHDARIAAGLTQADVGRAVGLSHAAVGRFERDSLTDLGIVRMSRMLAVVGRELSVKVYPGGSPIRDRAHLDLLERLRSRLHDIWPWRTEVPLPHPGDLRAWDAILRTSDVRIGVEAETRPRDAQELERRLALKRREGGVDRLILLIADTRSNRAFLRECGPGFRAAFPVAARDALRVVAAGRDPGGDSIILL